MSPTSINSSSVNEPVRSSIHDLKVLIVPSGLLFIIPANTTKSSEHAPVRPASTVMSGVHARVSPISNDRSSEHEFMNPASTVRSSDINL